MGAREPSGGALTMTAMIRNEHDLLALRISQRIASSGSELAFDLWRGSERLGEHRVPTTAFGLPESPTVRAYENARFTLPPESGTWLRAAYEAHRHCPDEPLWLELRPSAGQAAILPWEELLGQCADGLILRIPNFAVDPRFVAGDRLRFVVCASSPIAKSWFQVARYVSDLVRHLQSAGIPRTQVHIFADAEAFRDLQALERSDPWHSVTVHSPFEAASFGIGGTELAEETSSRSRLASPWLRWMRAVLRRESVDAVHFACPGYFSDSIGALALARSPAANLDAASSHFVGASELAAFLNGVGALSVGFSTTAEVSTRNRGMNSSAVVERRA
ncbi:MAG: hypothetical protein ACHREM_07085 [Polyangiales bacterium]